MGHIVDVNLSGDVSELVGLCVSLGLSDQAYRQVPNQLNKVTAKIEIEDDGTITILAIDKWDVCPEDETCEAVRDLKDDLVDADAEVRRLEIEVEELQEITSELEYDMILLKS